jgi:hypothetical protein
MKAWLIVGTLAAEARRFFMGAIYRKLGMGDQLRRTDMWRLAAYASFIDSMARLLRLLACALGIGCTAFTS